MAATTISRTAYNLLVDDDGSGTTGTIWGKSNVDDILDAIDAILAGNVTVGGTLAAEGFGTHAFSAGGTGFNRLDVRNTTAGAGNGSRIGMGNDVAALRLFIDTYSSTFTSSGRQQANGSLMENDGVGGMAFSAANAVGMLRFFTGSGPTEWARVTADGGFALKDGITAPATVAGFTSLYVDSADGDLKVKFGDGTVKTLATDT
jgi:hypothetical protein